MVGLDSNSQTLATNGSQTACNLSDFNGDNKSKHLVLDGLVGDIRPFLGFTISVTAIALIARASHSS